MKKVSLQALNRNQYKEMEWWEANKMTPEEVADEYRVNDLKAERVALLMGRSNGPEHRELLDLGCGLCRHRVMLENLLRAKYTGVDFLKENAEKANSVDVHCMSADELPFAWKERFHYVYASHILEHVEEPEKVLREIYKVLEAGGILGHRTPHVLPFPDSDPSHITELTIDEWVALYEKVSFEILITELDDTEGHAEEAQITAIKRG